MDKPLKEMSCTDEYGNSWRLTMEKMTTKTNRFDLSFWFNEKKFSLSKLQSNRSADDTWELLEKISKTPPKTRPSVSKETNPQPYIREAVTGIRETILVPREEREIPEDLSKLPAAPIKRPVCSSPSRLPTHKIPPLSKPAPSPPSKLPFIKKSSSLPDNFGEVRGRGRPKNPAPIPDSFIEKRGRGRPTNKEKARMYK